MSHMFMIPWLWGGLKELKLNQKKSVSLLEYMILPRGYKTFSMLNSAEHEI